MVSPVDSVRGRLVPSWGVASAFFLGVMLRIDAVSAQEAEKVAGPATVAHEPVAKGARVERDLTLEATGKDAALEVLGWVNNREVGWISVCRAPCSTRAFVGWEYRVGGQGVTASRSFVIEPGTTTLRVRANPQSSRDDVLGHVLTLTGASATAVGTGLWLFGTGLSAECPDPCSADDLSTAGIVTGAVGLVMLFTGIMMSLSTSITIEDRPRTGARFQLGSGIALSGTGLSF